MFRRRTVALAAALALLAGGALAQGAHEEKYPEKQAKQLVAKAQADVNVADAKAKAEKLIADAEAKGAQLVKDAVANPSGFWKQHKAAVIAAAVAIAAVAAVVAVVAHAGTFAY